MTDVPWWCWFLSGIGPTLVVLVVLLVLFVDPLARWRARNQVELLRRRERETVVVTMRSGATYKGVLFEVDGKSLVLRNAEAWGHNGDGHAAVDGELLLARADVEFLQRP